MKKYSSYLLVLFLFVLIFRSWFFKGLISAGDFSFYSSAPLKEINILPYAWGWNLALDGLGSFVSPLSWLHFVEVIPLLFLKVSHLNWPITERLFYLYPLLVFLLLIPAFVIKKFLPSVKFLFFAVLIFSLNTYILMLIGGGQIFVSLAYSLFPLIFYFLVSSFYNQKLSKSLLAGLLFSLEIMLDLRIAYVLFFAFVIYVFFNLSFKKEFVIKFLYSFFILLLTAFLINSYWLIPILAIRRNTFNQLGEIFSSDLAVKFFSFAKLENSISLLHPNWPENLFGKVYFMRAEFLFIPLLAYSFLFFIKKLDPKIKKTLFFFGFLGLLGSFLAKGANDPFGFIYIFLFNNVPGFVMFRDPTKWYVLTALSYSILIPFSVGEIYTWIKKIKFRSSISIKLNNKIINPQNLFLLVLVLYFLFLIKPSILGQIRGTFKTSFVPNEYIKLTKIQQSDERYYRTLWVPQVQRFAFRNSLHLVISARSFFKEADDSKVIKILKTDATKFDLEKTSVKYVIIPYDSQGEIFLKDRKFDNQLYEKTIADLRRIKWLKEIDEFGKIKVFEVENNKDHFWSPSKNLRINYKYINPVKYEIVVNNARKGDILVFSEGFDNYWQVKDMDFKINSIQFDTKFNSFKLIRDGNYSLTAYYSPQNWVNFGLAISGLSLISIIGILVGLKLRPSKLYGK